MSLLGGYIMALTEFGKVVRKARIDADCTLLTMSNDLGTSPAYLSGLETGSKKISKKWVEKITNFFKTKNIKLDNLQELANVSNNAVPLDNLSEQQKLLVAGFARSTWSSEELKKFADLLVQLNKKSEDN